MLVLTPTAIKIKLDGKTQIKDGYNHTFKIILSIHRLNTFVLQLNEVRAAPGPGWTLMGERAQRAAR